eukprot:TRINITY_DN15939_c0_g1_i4.p1 TRINITY_DN15939_c0_g1~~TRINITY_DN15939_c0_g1_i4.p1  ORF type:complete len:390 (-),score=52.56 TRINITY_DN15939_c0_g1_i4:90-1259(-)
MFCHYVGSETTIQLEFRKGLSGAWLFTKNFPTSMRMKDLKDKVAKHLAMPSGRLRKKSRQILLGTITLVAGEKSLKDDSTLEESVLQDNSIVQVIVQAPPKHVRRKKSQDEMLKCLHQWWRCFTDDSKLGSLGCQRIEGDIPQEAEGDEGGYRFVQVQTGQALPAVRPRDTRDRKIAVAEELEEILPNKHVGPEWHEIAACILKGKPPPAGQSLLTVYEEIYCYGGPLAYLITIVRNSDGFYVLSFGGCLDEEGASGLCMKQVRAEDIQNSLKRALAPQRAGLGIKRNEFTRAVDELRDSFGRLSRDARDPWEDYLKPSQRRFGRTKFGHKVDVAVVSTNFSRREDSDGEPAFDCVQEAAVRPTSLKRPAAASSSAKVSAKRQIRSGAI